MDETYFAQRGPLDEIGWPVESFTEDELASAVALRAPGWPWFYEYLKDPPGGGVRYAAGVAGYKTALIANGYPTGIITSAPFWGNFARDRTVEFQRAHNQTDDGIVGPKTGKALLRIYVVTWEDHYGIPDHLAGRQGTLESNNHAVAQGWADAGDEGWGQIHLSFHPDITLAQAWDPAFAIKWLCGQLWSNHANLKDYDAALAAYNVGYSTAKAWLAAGKPDHGGTIWHTDSGDVDTFTRASEYVALVRDTAY